MDRRGLRHMNDDLKARIEQLRDMNRWRGFKREELLLDDCLARIEELELESRDWQVACGKQESDHYAAREHIERLKADLETAEAVWQRRGEEAVTSERAAEEVIERVMTEHWDF